MKDSQIVDAHDIVAIAKWVRGELKTQFPTKDGYKFSVRSGGNNLCSSLYVSVMSAPFKIVERGDEYQQVNHHWIDKYESYEEYVEWECREPDSVMYTKEGWLLLNQLKKIITHYHYDRSDVQFDYFDTNYYIHLEVGKWDKPFMVSQGEKQEVNMKALSETKKTEGNVVPPLPALEWEKEKESTFKAVDGDGNTFWKWTAGDQTFYLVELNPDRYGYGIAQGSKNLEEAWETALTKVITNYEEEKLQAENKLKAVVAKFNNVPVDQVNIDIRIEGKTVDKDRNYNQVGSSDISDLTLLLMYLTGWEEDVRKPTHPGEKPVYPWNKIFRAMKGYKFEVLNNLEEKRMIIQYRHRPSRSVLLTPDGIKKAMQIQKKYSGAA